MCADGMALRPSVPPVFWISAGVWAGIWLAEKCTWEAYADCGSPWRVALIGLACLALLLAFRRRALFALALGGLVAGLLCGTLFWSNWSRQVESLAARGHSRWAAEITGDPMKGQFGDRSAIMLRGGAHAVCAWNAGDKLPAFGQEVEFFGSLMRPGADEFGRRAHRQGNCGSISARRARTLGRARSVRGSLSAARESASAILSTVPGRGGDLLLGLVIGDRARLAGTVTESDFRTTGLSHLVAVSGSHLVVVAALSGWALGHLPLKRTYSVAVLLAVLGTYVVLTGVQPSALRAWAMGGVVSLSGLGFRRADRLGALAAIVGVFLCLWPPCAFDIGFTLSVLAVGGLVIFGRLAEQWVGALLPRILAPAASPVALALVAQIATAPVSIPTFGVVSIISPLANVLAVPLMSIALTVGIAGVVASVISAPIGRPVLMLAGSAANACAAVAHVLAGVPHACILLGADAGIAGLACAVLATAVWLTWPAPNRRKARLAIALALALVLGARAPAGGTTSVTAFDVGQGDAILIQSGGASMLVDAGPSESALREALIRGHVTRLDWLLLTHMHADHVGGVDALEGTVPVDNVAVSMLADAADQSDLEQLCQKTKAHRIQAGDSFRVGELLVEVLWPGTQAIEDENGSSLVLLVSRGESEVLLTGDAEAEVLEVLCGAASAGNIDVLKVGHHGSKASVSEKSLAVLDPEVAVISVGAGNRFGHPARSTLGQLKAAGAAIYRCDRDGDVRLVFAPRGIEIVCTPVAGADSGMGH